MANTLPLLDGGIVGGGEPWKDGNETTEKWGIIRNISTTLGNSRDTMILEYVYIHVLYLQYIHVTSNKSVQVVNLCFCTPRKHRAFGVTSPDITGTQINGSVYVDILSTLTLVK